MEYWSLLIRAVLEVDQKCKWIRKEHHNISLWCKIQLSIFILRFKGALAPKIKLCSYFFTTWPIPRKEEERWSEVLQLPMNRVIILPLWECQWGCAYRNLVQHTQNLFSNMKLDFRVSFSESIQQMLTVSVEKLWNTKLSHSKDMGCDERQNPAHRGHTAHSQSGRIIVNSLR